MIYKKFQELSLSGLGLGLMRLPVKDTEDGKNTVIDEPAAEELIDYAYQNGVNYFDTAWGYHGGNSEIVAGKCLSKFPRESYLLASKFPGFDLSNMENVQKIFERQLEKCQTPYFDFYLFHNVCERNIDAYLDPQYGLMEYLLKQKENGRIRHLGFSAHGKLDVLKRFLDAYGEHMEFCQLQINYMDWHFQDAEKKVALMREAGIPVWVMEPLRGGKLANVSEEIAAAMQTMRPQETVPGWAFRFLQAIPDVKMILSGMSNMDQLRANIATFATDEPLDQQEFQKLVALVDEGVRGGESACTACSYCTDYCPKKLPIPKLIALYYEHKLTGSASTVPASVRKIEPEKRSGNCIGCRSCEQVCPQQIRISEIMKKFSDGISLS